MSIVSALSVSAIFAVFGFPYRFYQCWYSWSRKGAAFGVLIYVAFAGFGAGLIGWLPAHLSRLSPTGNAWLDGMIFGLAGSLTVRADFSSKSTTEPREMHHVASILGKGIEWSTELLDHVLRHEASIYLHGLQDRELLAVTRDLIYEIKAKPTAMVPKIAKAAVMKKVVEAMKTFSTDPQSDRRDEARERLIHFCLEYMVRERVIKPSVEAAPSPSPAATAH
ncbi:hypothetical protein [Actinoplanes sp. NPDC049681]|uniref:hypothetical protein n=1 Tax=Actinoplanes sp. NPDC049681 TaxID=3363905 RepID=UPI0037995836